MLCLSSPAILESARWRLGSRTSAKTSTLYGSAVEARRGGVHVRCLRGGVAVRAAACGAKAITAPRRQRRAQCVRSSDADACEWWRSRICCPLHREAYLLLLRSVEGHLARHGVQRLLLRLGTRSVSVLLGRCRGFAVAVRLSSGRMDEFGAAKLGQSRRNGLHAHSMNSITAYRMVLSKILSVVEARRENENKNETRRGGSQAPFPSRRLHRAAL